MVRTRFVLLAVGALVVAALGVGYSRSVRIVLLLSAEVPHHRDASDGAVVLQSRRVARQPAQLVPTPSREAKEAKGTRRPGRSKVDLSNHGLVTSAEGINHAWPHHIGESHCHGLRSVASCVRPESVEYLRRHVLLGIVTGREDVFRVEIANCTWLAHFPPHNAFILSDVVPSVPRTSHQWVRGVLPDGVDERDGDLFSPHVKKGYVHAVRSAKQGYSASWIVAQFRFAQGLEVMSTAMFRANVTTDYRWALLVDDDTVINWDHLVRRLQRAKHDDPLYLSRRGWGGAGHFFSRGAMSKVRAGLASCVDRWMVRQFHASDAMLLKCAGHLKLQAPLEPTMSHCPASHVRGRMLDSQLVSMHAKKDLYPSVLLATWRLGLYYLGFVCGSNEASKLAIEYSACAFGSCKSQHCTKRDDEQKMHKWMRLSGNETLQDLPFPPLHS